MPGRITVAISKFANMVKGHVGLQPGDTDAFRKEHSRLPGLPEEKSLAPRRFFCQRSHMAVSVCHFGKGVALEGK